MYILPLTEKGLLQKLLMSLSETVIRIIWLDPK